MLTEHKDVIERIEKYDQTFDPSVNRQVLEPVSIDLNIIPEEYQLPDLNQVYDNMIHRIDTIKNNGYLLPQITEEDVEQRKQDIAGTKKLVCPVYFFGDLNS